MSPGVSYENICQEIKSKVNLVDEMEKHGLTLMNSGTNRKKCVCPFHQDNDPSLIVNTQDEEEWFYCFGCQKSGTVIDFIMEINQVPLSGAIKYFCDNYSLDFDGNIDISNLVIRTVNKKIRIPVASYFRKCSRIVKDFLDESDTPLKDYLSLKQYLKEIDTAASTEDYIVLREMCNILKIEIEIIKKNKEKTKTS